MPKHLTQYEKLYRIFMKYSEATHSYIQTSSATRFFGFEKTMLKIVRLNFPIFILISPLLCFIGAIYWVMSGKVAAADLQP